MAFSLHLSDETKTVIARLERDAPGRAIKVKQTLGLIERDPRYRGLNTHPYDSKTGPHGEKIWESYVENKTPAAYMVFWYYGPGQRAITVLSITPHP